MAPEGSLFTTRCVHVVRCKNRRPATGSLLQEVSTNRTAGFQPSPAGLGKMVVQCVFGKMLKSLQCVPLGIAVVYGMRVLILASCGMVGSECPGIHWYSPCVAIG